MLNKIVEKIAYLLSAIGAINWGLVWFTPTKFDLVVYLSNFIGQQPMVENVLYGLIALSGIYVLINIFGGCTSCKC